MELNKSFQHYLFLFSDRFLNLCLQPLCHCLNANIISPFPSRSSTPISRRTASSFCVETIASLPQRPAPHTFLPHCPTDGRRTDPSLLVRSVTSVAHLGPSGRVRASPCAGDRGHVSCCASKAPQLQMLLICRLMYFFVRQSAGECSKPAIQLEQNRFLHCKVRATASGG